MLSSKMKRQYSTVLLPKCVKPMIWGLSARLSTSWAASALCAYWYTLMFIRMYVHGHVAALKCVVSRVTQREGSRVEISSYVTFRERWWAETVWVKLMPGGDAADHWLRLEWVTWDMERGMTWRDVIWEMANRLTWEKETQAPDKPMCVTTQVHICMMTNRIKNK